ncbi:hypothetical protein B6V01_005665 [Methanosarcinales archaeon ex4572_44]|nr:MAG: hypothetical protein B6U67_06030 [Methanosarcinales archaeon ex4484_138]PHP45096.1 MAG: hypothetical protein B6V01_005665 [Methanosarcinales archaeon ex4572_44]RLG27321.1 MAG: hypothetical protein DRN85_00600 [Methanosarcinales archaeon]RLG27582.1 MAG: hypothetical protein DRN70_01970 [Methanosarcinales archaeon]
MANLNSTITLIGTRLAKIGNEFIFYGPTPDCGDCKLKNTCNNLEPGNKYKITGVRNGQVHACAVHDTGVYAVEVIPAPTTALVESKMVFNGSKKNRPDA